MKLEKLGTRIDVKSKSGIMHPIRLSLSCRQARSGQVNRQRLLGFCLYGTKDKRLHL